MPEKKAPRVGAPQSSPASRAARGPARGLSLLVTPALFACLLALGAGAPPAGAAEETQGTTPEAGGTQEARENPEAAPKSAPSPATKKPAPAPRATPAPSPRAAPRRAPAPASSPAPPAVAAPSPEPVFRFTDDDLEKYRKPAPAPEVDAEGEEEDVPGAAPASRGEGTKAPPGRPPAAGPKAGVAPAAPAATTTHTRRPVPIAPPLGQDPLKSYRDREAKEKFRAEQIERIRGAIAHLRERLGYLKAKRLGVANPLVGIPEGATAEETERDARMKPKELLDVLDREIEAVQAEIEETENNLAAIETRFEPGP